MPHKWDEWRVTLPDERPKPGRLTQLWERVLSGADKLFDNWMLGHAPDWLVQATTSI